MARYGNTLIAAAIRPDAKLGVLRTNMIGKHYAHEDGYDGYDVVEFLPPELTPTKEDYIGGNTLKTTEIIPEGLTDVKAIYAPVFPNLSCVVIADTTQVVTGLGTALAGLICTVVVPNTLLSDYQTAYASQTNLTFVSWTLGQVVVIPFIGNTTLTAEYVELYASVAGGDPTQVIKVIVPNDFTEYSAGAFDALSQFASLHDIESPWFNGALGELYWDIPYKSGQTSTTLQVAYCESLVAGNDWILSQTHFVIIPTYFTAYENRWSSVFINAGITGCEMKRVPPAWLYANLYWRCSAFSDLIIPIQSNSSYPADFFNVWAGADKTLTFRMSGECSINLNRFMFNISYPYKEIRFVGAAKLSLVSVSSMLYVGHADALQTLIMENLVSYCTLGVCELSHNALVNLINSLGTPETTQTFTIGATNLAKLTARDIAIATAKNWQLA